MSDTDIIDDEPRRLLELASAPQALHDALTLLDGEQPAPLARAKHDALFRAAVEKTRAPARGPRLALAFAAACLIGAVASAALVQTLRPPEYVAEAGAAAVLEGRTLTVTAGRVVVHPRQGLIVRAGGVELFVRGGRTAMDVTVDGVVIHVEEGVAVVREAGVERTLSPGEQLDTRAPKVEAAPKLELPPAHTGSCAAGAEACLAALAAGDGLEAETALYELALEAHERGDTTQALARFLEHQRRFPDGVLAPEASIGLMLGHLARRDAASASVEAHRFLARFPSDPRADRVLRLAH